MVFPAPHVIEPTTSHTHTIILLHGRGSDGEEFAEELLSSNSSSNKNLTAHFPSCRWVFPTAPGRWSTIFQEEFPAWFDIYSVADPSERQDLQADGLRESMMHILEVIRHEVDGLDGKNERLVLGAMSQGMATALWTLLCSPEYIKGQGIGGFIGMSGWLPFADKVIERLRDSDSDISGKTEESLTTLHALPELIGCQEVGTSPADYKGILSTPGLILHGVDDVWVDVELGRQAHRIMVQLGMKVDWKEDNGAENDGHWVKEPEGFDSIVAFLENVVPE